MSCFRWGLCAVGLVWVVMTTPLFAGNFTSGSESAVKFGVHEILLTGDDTLSNPFDTIVTVQFTPPSGAEQAKSVWAFYDGKNSWRARVFVSETGEWKWSTSCNTDAKLHDNTGIFHATDSKLPGRILVHPKNPRQWMNEDGRWFLNLSDTAYFLLCRQDGEGDPVSDEQARRYVQDDVAQGITSLRCFLASREGGFEETPAQWRQWFFHADGDFDQFRLDNFQSADRRLRMLLDEFPDLAVQLIMFPLERYAGDDRFWTALKPEQRERLLRQLVARYAAYPQLLWLTTNDAHYGPKFPNSNAMVREVGAFLMKHDPWQHPRSAGHARTLPFFFSEEDWVTYIHIEHKHDLGALQYGQYHKLAKPVFLGEDRYEQDRGPQLDPTHMRYWQRRLFWAWLLSGGSANYGGRWWAIQPYSEIGTKEVTFKNRPNILYRTPLTGLDSVKFIRDYFETRKIELSDFEPDHALVRDGAEEVRAPKLMRRDRDEFLVYHPNSAEDEQHAKPDETRKARFKLDLTGAKGTFTVEWFRAEDGAVHDDAHLTGGAVVELVAPWTGYDVILRLRKQK